MKTSEILENITSRDTHKVWLSVCEIISLGQNREKILPLIEHLPEIIEKTKDLKMGGMFAPNQRFIDFAIRTIEFHRDNNSCPCTLFTEHGIDPQKEFEKGNIEITETVYDEGKWVDYYSAHCQKCSQKFKIIERESHYIWWAWEKV
ncbi:MAG: hypothetical protein MUC29_00730 [Pyrinomonadaceae bacterium]|jgi:hypothetical protein|nr:hypothetical protein [Pyrinomonadaceae bacterium]